MDLYLYLNGSKRGPLAEERVKALLADGTLLDSDLAAEQPDGAYQTLSAFKRFTEATLGNVAGTESQIEPILPVIEGPLPLPVTRGLASPPSNPLPAVPSNGGAALPRESLGPYARSMLTPNEKAFHKTSLHWIVFARFAVLALLVFLFVAMPFAIVVQILTGSQLGWFALPLPAFIMLPPTLAFAGSELVVTDRRVLIKTGIVSRQTLEMFISRIESVRVEQGFLGRILDYGTITIRGTGGSDEPFEAIAHPLEFRNYIQRLQSAPLT